MNHDKAVVAEPRSVVLGTAGHIDHGKTSLVLALTGTDADRLPEEKSRGITIDIGFASMALQGARGESFDTSIIDVPGHHAFIRNMLAGAGGVEAVMLIVAADEGVKPQTREHLQICQLLGLQHGLVVLTKTDRVDVEQVESARREVHDLVRETFLAGCPVVAVSARTRNGLGLLKAELAELFCRLPQRATGRIPRLPIDRVFSVRGFGTVVTGTLQGGSLRSGDTLAIQPRGLATRVRGLQVHGRPRRQVDAPNRVALNLAGVESSEVARGDVITPASTFQASSILDIRFEPLPGASALRHRQKVSLYAFTAEAQATALAFQGDKNSRIPGKDYWRFKLDRPMFLMPGDRVVLRQPSPAETLGGGVVLDAQPLLGLRKAATSRWLEKLDSSAAEGQKLAFRIERRGSKGCTDEQLANETGWTAEKLKELTAPLRQQGFLVYDVGYRAFIVAGTLARVGQDLVTKLEASKEGLSRPELRFQLGVPEWVLQRALSALMTSGRVFAQADRFVCHQDPGSETTEKGDVSSLEALERLYLKAGLASPLVNEAGLELRISPDRLRKLITTLLRAGSLVRLGSDALLIHKQALLSLISDLQKDRGQTLDVGQFKQRTGLTRKHAIPLLEYLDGSRVTRTIGKNRIIC